MNKTKIIIAVSILLIGLFSLIFINRKTLNLTPTIAGNNTVVKKLVPFERESGNYIECLQSVEYDYPTQTYEVENGKVYFDFFILDGIDENSFEALGHREIFAKDKDSIYVYGNALPNMDLDSFKYLNSYFIKDKNGVYFYNSGNISKPEFDLQKVVKCEDLLYMFSWEPVTSENSARFGQKINNAFFNIKKIDSFDIATFDIVKVDQLKDSLFGKYVKDKNGVYLVQINRYALENESSYQIIKIEGADPESFEVMSQDVVKDKYTTFAADYDPERGIATFRVINSTKLTKWQDDKMSFEYPSTIFVSINEDKNINLREDSTGAEYEISLNDMTNDTPPTWTFDLLYKTLTENQCDGCNANIMQLGNYKYIKSTAMVSGKLIVAGYQTIINNKYFLVIVPSSFYIPYSSEEFAKSIEKIISSLVIKN